MIMDSDMNYIFISVCGAVPSMKHHVNSPQLDLEKQPLCLLITAAAIRAKGLRAAFTPVYYSLPAVPTARACDCPWCF